MISSTEGWAVGGSTILKYTGESNPPAQPDNTLLIAGAAGAIIALLAALLYLKRARR